VPPQDPLFYGHHEGRHDCKAVAQPFHAKAKRFRRNAFAVSDEDFFVELGFFVEYDASERCVAVQFTREVRIMHEGLDLFALTAQIGRSFQSLRNDGETVRGKRAGFGVCAPA
jgi:hypothetical protein